MKKCKRIITLLTSICWLTAMTQNAPLTHAPYITGAATGTVNVAITVEDFTAVGAVNLTLLYDPLALTYQAATPHASFNAANFSVTSSPYGGGKNQLVISYPYGYPSVTLIDGTTMVTLQFSFTTANFLNHSALEWFDDGTSCEYRDASDNPLNDAPFSDFYFNGLIATQVAPVTYLPTQDYYATGSIEVPITVDDFVQIPTISLTFEYDSTIVNYEGTFTSSLGGIAVGDSPSSGTLKRIVIGWFGSPTTLADGSEIIRLDFTYNLGSSALQWIDSGPDCEYSDANYMVLYDSPTSDFYIDGFIFQKMAPKVHLDTVPGTPGELLVMPVTVEDFVDINSIALTIDYDPAELSFECATPHPSISSGFDASTNLSDQVEIAWTGSSEVTLPDGETLFYLAFISTGTTTSLTWYNVGSTCEFTTGPSYTALNDLPTGDYYFDGLVEPGPGTATWTGTTSSDWNTSSNWDGNQVPDSFFDVFITTGNSPPNWPSFSGDLIVGQHCKDISMSGASELTVSGDLTIETGRLLEIIDIATVRAGGDWTNHGMFDPGAGTVEFNGSVSGAISPGVTPGNSLQNYSVETFTAGMTNLSGASAGPTGDNAHSDVSIGFDFTYLGVDYNQARINTNGWISLNASGDDATSGDNSRLFFTVTPTTVLAPWWDDLLVDGSAQVSYLTEGSAPNRVFTVEWKDVLSYSSGATARLSFQVKLFESSNTIEFHYGSLLAGTHNANEGASLGIKGTAGGTGDFIEATTGSTTNILTCFDSGSGNWPAVNYRIWPPPNSDKEIFWQVLVTKTSSATLQVNRDTDIEGTSP